MNHSVSRGEEILTKKQLRKRTFALTLTAVQVYRLVGVIFLYEMLRGNLPPTFAIPAGVGDVLIGITAPVVALALRRGGIVTWVAAVVWNALGITDLVYAGTLGNLSRATYMTTSYLAVIPAILVPIAAAIHLLTISTLLNTDVRVNFVTRGDPSTAPGHG